MRGQFKDRCRAALEPNAFLVAALGKRVITLDDAAACLARAILAAKDWHSGGGTEEFLSDAAIAAVEGKR